ncbi:50S ribosomal protein L18Ae [Candidatus Nanohalovita haloferacivicina]|uniref:50S ribosomal protein L18Ae n=1 Tax=Candidatus Nanohalovita haloferacivicina TaxID=2978046 RepID=UPI00325FDAFC|nr:Ribosomal protein L20A (L18A) [Candidatus Nanohalobia archaeon BNXNv]
MTVYTFSGEINLGRSTHGFEREVDAESENHAEEKLYAELGSEHSIPRSKITIEDVSEQE